jgi:proteasome lid subunit RPN8/RPN11
MTNNEELCLIRGRRLFNRWWYGWVDFSTYVEGECASVPFDLDYVRTQKNIIGFFHTHPFSVAEPSHTDLGTMKGLVFETGKPLLCMIHGIDGSRHHWFVNDVGNPREMPVYYKKNSYWMYGRIP